MKLAMHNWPTRNAIAFGVLGLLGGAANAAVHIDGQVQTGGGAVAQSTVTLWAASARAPVQIAQTRTGFDGAFSFSIDQTVSADAVLYLVAKGGQPGAAKAGADPGLALLSVLGNNPPPKVVVNELT